MKSLKLPLWWGKYFTVYGGPYLDRPKNTIGVKMAAEILEPCTIRIDTKDFGVPPVRQMKDGLDRAVSYILLGEPVYVGCMGGIGRTGLFLAILARAFGLGGKDPVGYVRQNYYSPAVETQAQRKYVMSFPISDKIKEKIAKEKWRRLLSWKNSLTRDLGQA
jgi:hypothetical protein